MAIFAEVTDNEGINDRHLRDSDCDYVQFGVQQWPKYPGQGWKNLGFLEKVLRFLGFLVFIVLKVF